MLFNFLRTRYMRDEFQTVFSGGMVDTPADGAAPADSYSFAANFDLVGGRLVSRPAVEVVRASTLGMEDVYGAAAFRFSDSAFGDVLFYVEHRPDEDSYAFCGYLLNAAGVYLQDMTIRFPDLFGSTDGRFYGSATELLAAPVVFLQVGPAAFCWVRRGAAVYCFRWDGSATGTPLTGAFTAVSTVYGTAGYVPACQAAVFAYGRVFLAVETAGGVYSSVSVSAPVDNSGVPQLVFRADKFDVGLGSAESILGFESLGSGMIVVFKRNSVWLLSGCDGDPAQIVCECLDAEHGSVGRFAAVTFDQGCWFIADDGIRVIELGGRARPQPVTSGIAKLWARVSFGAEPWTVPQAVVYGDRLLFEVVVDAQVAYLVYSLSAKCWVGVWNGSDCRGSGLFVGDLLSGRQLKFLGDGLSVKAFSLTAPLLFNAAYAGVFQSRDFYGGEAVFKYFTRARACFRSFGATGGNAVALAVAGATVAGDTGASVAHVLPVTHAAGVAWLVCFVGRYLRRCALKLTFTAGSAEILSAGVSTSEND